MIPDPDTIRVANAAVAVLGLFVVTVGLRTEWHELGTWRWVLGSFVAQQAVIVYGSVEAIDDTAAGVPTSWRVYALLGTLTAVLVTALLVTRARHREQRRKAGAGGE